MENFPKIPLVTSRCSAILDRMLNQQTTLELFPDEIESLRQEGILVPSLLYEFVAKGYLLHGCLVRSQELLPQPGDDDRKEAKRVVGVYATDIPGIALFKGTVSNTLMQARYPSYTLGWHVPPGPHGAQFYGTAPIDEARSSGFVYLLRKNNFTKIDEGEYVSTQSEWPLCLIPVEPNDFDGDFKLQER